MMAPRGIFISAAMATLHITRGSTMVQQVRAEIFSKGDAVSASEAFVSGASAALTESGYQQVVKLHSDAEMKQFIVRLLSMHGLTVETESMGELDGFVPWFSGNVASQNIRHLLAELTGAKWVSDSTAEAKDGGHSENKSASSEIKNKSHEKVAFAEKEVHVDEETVSNDDLEEAEAAEDEEKDENREDQDVDAPQEMPSFGWSMGPKVGSSGAKHCFVKESSSESASSQEMMLQDAQLACDADEKCNFIWSHGCDMSWRKCYASAPATTAGDKSSCTLIKPTEGAVVTESTIKDATHAVQQLILQALLESDIDKVPAHVLEELKKKKERTQENRVVFMESGDETMEEDEDAHEPADLDYSEDDAMMTKKSKAEILQAKAASESRMVRLFKWLTR